MRKIKLRYYLIPVLYFFLILILSFLKGWLDGFGEVFSLLIGTIIGWFIVWFDLIAYVYILHPEVQVSKYIMYKINQKDIKGAINLLMDRQDGFDKLTTRSVLFQLCWIILALFVLTTTGLFNRALIMGLGFRILRDEWSEYLKDKNKLKKLLFWQIKREVNDKELKLYLYFMTGLFIWFMLFWF